MSLTTLNFYIWSPGTQILRQTCTSMNDWKCHMHLTCCLLYCIFQECLLSNVIQRQLLCWYSHEKNYKSLRIASRGVWSQELLTCWESVQTCNEPSFYITYKAEQHWLNPDYNTQYAEPASMIGIKPDLVLQLPTRHHNFVKSKDRWIKSPIKKITGQSSRYRVIIIFKKF